MKKITSILLSIIMLISTITVLPLTIYADDDYSDEVFFDSDDGFAEDYPTDNWKKSGDYQYSVNAKNEVTLEKYTKPNSKRVVIPAKIKGKKVVKLGPFLFCDYRYTSDTLEEIVIPDGVKVLGEGVFHKIPSLKSVYVPDSVTKIEDGAFLSCRNLSTLRLGKNIQYVGVGVFNYTPKLEKFDDGKGGTYFNDILIRIANDVKEYHVKEGTTVIPSLAMDGKNDIEKLYFPKSLRYISKSAFHGCSKLNTLVLNDGLKEIGEKAFYDCKMLKSVTIPKSVTKIGKHAIGYYFYSPIYETPYNRPVEYKLVKDFKIKGYTNSTAQKYAKQNKIKFTSNVLKKPAVKATAGKNQIKIKCTKNSDITGFEVRYKRNKQTFTKTFKTAKSATKKINKLPKGKYKVQVRTYHTSGSKKAYSPWTAAKSVTVK